MSLDTRHPGLYRSGDIGVSAEWRTLMYDWMPVVTPLGVTIYSYLRDIYAQQRAMFPLLLTPEGPTKAQMQRRLGYKSGWALQGPEYLLNVIGLAHVELRYGQSADPDHPQRTRIAYYSIGRLDQPALDWSMLDHILNALAVGLESPARPDAAKAQAAIQVLSQAGFLQLCDPAELFWELGAWPYLLPSVIADPRWEALFSSLHTPARIPTYREQALRWTEYAQNKLARLARQHQAMTEMLQSAQRHGLQGPHVLGVSSGYQIPATEAVQVTSIASVADESLDCREAPQVTSTASATRSRGSLGDAINALSAASDSESLARDQLTLTSLSVNVRDSLSGATGRGDSTLPIHPHLQDHELHTTKLDGRFWTTVNHILYGFSARYPHTAGEKKAAERQFFRRNIPTGVALAALRLVMTLPVELRPPTFADAIRMDTFQRGVQQAMQLLPPKPQSGPSWESFLWSYRSVGLTDRLRDVGYADYMVLRSLYAQHPDECWEVLSRCHHAAEPVKLSPQYLRRAITNNQRAAAERTFAPAGAPDAVPPIGSDPRLDLLAAEGLSGVLLADDITEEFIRAWIIEADLRAPVIKKRAGWLAWGIRSGYWPHEHPQLPPRPGQLVNPPPAHDVRQIPDAQPESELARLWRNVLMGVRNEVSLSDYETWLQSTQLVDMSDEVLMVAVPHVLARDGLRNNPQLLQTLTAAAQAVIPACVELTIVIDPGMPLC